MVTMVGCVVMGMYTLLDLAGRWGVDRFHHSVAECGGCESIQWEGPFGYGCWPQRCSRSDRQSC